MVNRTWAWVFGRGFIHEADNICPENPPVHPEALRCDFLSATARKFLRGPRGAGLLWVSDRVLESGMEPLFPDLRGADWIHGSLYRAASSFAQSSRKRRVAARKYWAT